MAGWKPVDNSARTEINEEEVQQLFYLIDTKRTGKITSEVNDKIWLDTVSNICSKF